MNCYKDFAYVYDVLMKDFGYEELSTYLKLLFDKCKKTDGNLVLDLGCGTGTLTNILGNQGYDLIGIDLSEDMLSVAKQKSNNSILYLCQDMTEFELYGTVDAIVSVTDSINYITDKRRLKRLFKLVQNYLNPGGIFVFDINSKYKIETVLGNNTYVDETEDVFCVWENCYDKNSGICDFYLNFFIKSGNEYNRFIEEHRERAYSIPELKEIILTSGLELVDVFGDKNFEKPKAKEERIFFVCRKQ